MRYTPWSDTMVHENILHVIGNTPLVKINRINPNPKVELSVKIEGHNPGGSVKDRIAHYMIKGAIARGDLTPEKTIIEPTSGNTGIGLAMVGAVLGYRVLVIMPENMSMERRRILKAFGADIILTPSEKGTDGAIETAHRLYGEDPEKYYFPNQFANSDNIHAHYETTALEIWEDTGGRVDGVVAGIGTTGTLMGVSKRLKELKPSIQIVAIEPNKKHRVQGLKNLDESIVPHIFDERAIDSKIFIDDETAFKTAVLLARQEGIFSGISAGAIMAGAMQFSEQLTGGTVVAILPDKGEKYLSCEDYCRYCEIKCISDLTHEMI